MCRPDEQPHRPGSTAPHPRAWTSIPTCRRSSRQSAMAPPEWSPAQEVTEGAIWCCPSPLHVPAAQYPPASLRPAAVSAACLVCLLHAPTACACVRLCQGARARAAGSPLLLTHSLFHAQGVVVLLIGTNDLGAAFRGRSGRAADAALLAAVPGVVKRCAGNLHAAFLLMWSDAFASLIAGVGRVAGWHAPAPLPAT